MSKREKDAGTGERSHQVLFSPIKGPAGEGRDILGPPREVSMAVHQLEGGDIALRFDSVPAALRTKGGGVLFISKVAERQPDHAPPERVDKTPAQRQRQASGKDRQRER